MRSLFATPPLLQTTESDKIENFPNIDNIYYWTWSLESQSVETGRSWRAKLLSSERYYCEIGSFVLSETNLDITDFDYAINKHPWERVVCKNKRKKNRSS